MDALVVKGNRMAGWEQAFWQADVAEGVPRRDRARGPYRRYVPDALAGYPLVVDPALAQTSADVERGIRALNGAGGDALAAVSRFLLRSEAIASSQIEGLSPSPKQVALAELGHHEPVRGVSAQAALVANNMTVVREATTRLVELDRVTVDDIVDLHRALLPDEPALHGLRERQNWIGGSSRHPLEADFVPPAAERVPDLMIDLVDYLNGSAHGPLVQAAVVHAQFETIHPFADGNGRVGRALIHTVLARRGVTTTAVLPISLVLATLSETYVAGLTGFRHGQVPGEAARVGIGTWLETFLSAASVAVEQSRELVLSVDGLREEWTERVAASRGAQGLRPAPRAGSATSRILETLAEAPVLTATTVSRILGVSFPAASNALEELRQAEVLTTRKIERNATAYIADEVLDLITSTERRLASTRFDTRLAAPSRPVPGRPA